MNAPTTPPSGTTPGGKESGRNAASGRVEVDDSALEHVRLSITGMHCAGCSGKVESVLGAIDGVQRAEVSLSGASADVSGRGLNPDRLAEAVRNSGYEARVVIDRPSVQRQRSETLGRQARSAAAWKRRAMVGVACSIPMIESHLPIFGISPHGPGAINWYTWVVAVLSVVVQVYVGSAFYKSAIKAALHRSTNMDTLVVIGATAAFGFSCVVFVANLLGMQWAQPLYFSESAALLTLISIGHWLEARTSAAAGTALTELLELQPDDVTVLEHEDDRDGTKRASADVEPDDLLLVLPGERVAVDGEIVHGSSTLDEAIITGESMPVERREGDAVVAGSLNLTGRIVTRATTSGVDTTVARMAEMVRKAQSSKAPIQRLADKVSSVFVPVVLVIAALAFVGWLVLGSENALASAIVNATTVLVISCPCALGLATPTAVMVGSGAASKRGIIVRNARALERCAHVNVIMLDKTGTLTTGKPSVLAADDDVLTLAAALAGESNHPLSVAISEEASRRELDVPGVSDLEEMAGRGLKGMVGGKEVQVVSERTAIDEGWMRQDDDRGEYAGATLSVVVVDGDFKGVVALSDAVREGAAEVIGNLHELGLRTRLLTGDRRGVALAIARQVGIDADDVRFEMRPEEKVDAVAQSADEGFVVAMVGDGINDAAALSKATALGGIGVAIGTGAAIAIEAADVVIPGHELDRLVTLVHIGRGSLRTIKQNLFFSFFYNVVAIPLAAFGLLGPMGPMIAAAAMGFSDVTVIGNSLRLKWKLSRAV